MVPMREEDPEKTFRWHIWMTTGNQSWSTWLAGQINRTGVCPACIECLRHCSNQQARVREGGVLPPVVTKQARGVWTIWGHLMDTAVTSYAPDPRPADMVVAEGDEGSTNTQRCPCYPDTGEHMRSTRQ
uniref:Uncharacterized protein n=1 Tax=Eutreptiella gymnastica TaxID=73025 RepID=A0A7S1N1R3_9EUGL